MSLSIFYGAECWVRASIPFTLTPESYARAVRTSRLQSAGTYIYGPTGSVSLSPRRLTWTGLISHSKQFAPTPIEELVGIFSSGAVHAAQMAGRSLLLFPPDWRCGDDVRVSIGKVVRFTFTHLPHWYHDDRIKELTKT